MFDIESSLKTCEFELQSSTVRERDCAADHLCDLLEYADLTIEQRVRIGIHLIEALWKETDEVVLESILHALGAANLPKPCPQIPWHRVGDYLSRLKCPLLGEYGLGMLGECGDPQMISYVQPYVGHPEAAIHDAATKALELLRDVPSKLMTESGTRCACPGCEEVALSDSSFCAFCEDNHYHSH